MKSIFTWHLFSLPKSFAIWRKYSSEAATKWFQVSMVTVRVAAYSGGGLLRRIPARPPAVALAAVRSTRRRLKGVCRMGRESLVCMHMLLWLMVTLLSLFEGRESRQAEGPSDEGPCYSSMPSQRK